MGHLELMKHDSGIKYREESSSGIEILMADAFAKITPTDPSDKNVVGSERLNTHYGCVWTI